MQACLYLHTDVPSSPHTILSLEESPCFTGRIPVAAGCLGAHTCTPASSSLTRPPSPAAHSQLCPKSQGLTENPKASSRSAARTREEGSPALPDINKGLLQEAMKALEEQGAAGRGPPFVQSLASV